MLGLLNKCLEKNDLLMLLCTVYNPIFIPGSKLCNQPVIRSVHRCYLFMSVILVFAQMLHLNYVNKIKRTYITPASNLTKSEQYTVW